jgi:hypothetical protein
MNKIGLNQTIDVQVIRKQQKLEFPVTCRKCGNKREWLIRCEHCGDSSEVKNPMNSILNLKGQFHIEHRDLFGNLKAIYDFPNAETDVGKDLLLDVMFNDVTQIANNSWFVGLIDNSGFTALADADTMASHTGWTEFTNYSETTRVAWGSGASSGQTVTNASPITFNISGAGGTVRGIFVVSNSSKSGGSGTLWSTGLFSASVPVTSGDQLKLTYSVSA